MVTSGISAPPTDEVAAVCGAMMPSGMPVPSSAFLRPYCISAAVGDERRDGGAGAGHEPDDDADERAAQERHPGAPAPPSSPGKRVLTSATPSTATETKPFSSRENTSPRPYAPTITTR